MLKQIDNQDKIFIAGHNGMVGSAIIRELRKKNYNNLITLDRSEINLTNRLKLKEWFSENKPSVVILAAAKVGGIYANDKYPADFLLENLKIQNNVIELAWEHNVKKLLFLGSSCIYPKFSKQPIKEEYLLTNSLEPTNEGYALAKIAGIKLCQYLRTQYQFNAISLMPTNLYGPGDNYNESNSHVIPALIRKFHEAKEKNNTYVKCWGTGSPKREFLHVDDLASACIFALENWDPDKTDYCKGKENKPAYFLNVGTGVDLTIKELAQLISKIFGYEGSIIWDKEKPDGTPRKLLDISKIRSIGWQAKIDLKEGLKKEIALFKENYQEGNIRY